MLVFAAFDAAHGRRSFDARGGTMKLDSSSTLRRSSGLVIAPALFVLSWAAGCAAVGSDHGPDAGIPGSDGGVTRDLSRPGDGDDMTGAPGHDAGGGMPPDMTPPPEPPFLPPTLHPFRAPAYPLVTHDPYFSVWSATDQLAGSWPLHWSGSVNGLTSMVRIDGKTYRLMGFPGSALPALPQKSVNVTPTRTVYRFGDAGIELRLIFTSPIIASNLELLGRPVTYITWEARATDGKSHTVSTYFDNSGELVTHTPDQQITWSRPTVAGLQVLQMGSKDQPILRRAGDATRIDWGYLYQAVPSDAAVQQSIAGHDSARNAFAAGGSLPADDTRQPRAASDDWPVLSTVLTLGSVQNDWVGRYLILAYDDVKSIELMTTQLQPYWRRNGLDAAGLLTLAANDYDEVTREARQFDADLVQDLDSLGSADYTELAVLSYRQALAAHKLAAGSDGKPLFFPKESSSNGCISTVDVLYPGAPLLLLMAPKAVEAMLRPVLDYAASSRWKFAFAPHDLGTYPKADGQVYGGGELSEDDQMPVEESGNMLILVAAYTDATGDIALATKYWPQLTKWAQYLEAQGFDPANQLSTDDFAGKLAHNANLSLKAILALGAYGKLCSKLGKSADATAYATLAQQFANQWTSAADDGDHYRLAFDKAGTFSQKYNLVWDHLLGLDLFTAAAKKETAYYLTKMNTYGLPLDHRATYTKLDWEVWTSMISQDPDAFRAFASRLGTFIRATPDRVPLTDWYQTTDARKSGFQARSVVGGVFLPLLYRPEIWQRWLQRAH
jgi:hypothetical protein